MDELHCSYQLKIQRIKSQLSTFLEFEDFQVIYKAQKRISSQLLYFVNCLHLNFLSSEALSTILKQCIKIIATLVHSTEQLKYGQRLINYAFVVKEYIKSVCPGSKLFNQELALARIEKNEQSKFYKSMSSNPISKEEIMVIKSTSSNCFFTNLNNNQLSLHNNQCLCCSRIFYKSVPLYNDNPYFSNVIGLSSVKAFLKGSIQKFATAMCNQGGGVILIGADQKDRILSAVGMKFNDAHSIKNCQKTINSALMNVKPKCKYRLQKIQVLQKYAQIENTSSNKTMLLCLRIVIFSEPYSQFTFSQGYNKGSQKCFKTYIMDNDKNETIQTPMFKAYELIQKLYRKGKRIQNNHKQISCLKPRRLDFFEIDNLLQSSGESQIDQEQRNNFLVLALPHTEKIVGKFMDYMKDAKQNFEYFRPFQNSFKNGRHNYWLANHEGEYEQLAYILKQFFKRECIENVPALYPVCLIVEILSTTFTQQVEKNLNLRLSQQFQIESCYQKKIVQIYKNKNHLNKKVIYLKFKDIQMSLFSYMCFDQMNLRPRFIDQEQCLINF